MAFLQVTKCLYKNILRLIPAIFSISFPVYGAAFFQPHITEGQNEPVCGAALNYYNTAYYSKAQTLEPLAADKISRPSFTLVESFGDEGALTKASINIDGQEKVLVYYRRMHSWRGDIFTGYLINPEQLSTLVEQIKSGNQTSIKPFYPQADEWAWRLEVPFLYEGKWYLDDTQPAFDANDGVRGIFRLYADGSSVKVCKLRIFEKFNSGNKLQTSALPFFSAYVKSMEEIMVSNGSCGTSNPEVWAEKAGKYFVSQSVLRPWALSFERGRFDPPRKLLNEHFEQWRYSDIWSYRERDSLENLNLDAQAELSLYLQKSFSYSADITNPLATSILQEMKLSYYSLASFDKAGVDFSRYQQLVNGGLSDWQLFAKEINSEDEKVIFPEFSLLVDNPTLIEKLPESKSAEKYVTIYGKDLLMVAAHMNNYDSVRYLVERGWSVDRVTTKEDDMCWEGPSRVNRSALTYAVENASPYLINYLIKSGADSEIVDSEKNNLDFYLQKNPRFTDKEKSLGLTGALKNYPLDAKVKPSFSCDLKLNRLEAAICKSEGLAIYDLELRDAYKRATLNTSVAESLKKSQIKWLGARSKECSQFAVESQLNACVARVTRARIRYLDGVTASF